MEGKSRLDVGRGPGVHWLKPGSVRPLQEITGINVLSQIVFSGNVEVYDWNSMVSMESKC